MGAVGLAVLLGAVPAAAAQVPPPPQQTGQQPPLRPLAVTQLDERRPASDLDSTRPLTITLADPTPIADLLLMLVRDTRLSIVADPDVEGVFRGELKDVTLRQALEMILQPHGLDYSAQGNLIRVFKRRLETRRFDLNYVAARRTLPSSAGADIFADVSAGVQTLLSSQGRFNVDRKAALLQATDYPDRLDQIQLYVDAVQNRATRQVQIQATVIEVVLDDESAAGIDWKAVMERAGDAVSLTSETPAAPAPAVGLHINDFNALLQAFASQGTVRVLATPTINALNNEPAMVRVGTEDGSHAITEGVVLSVTSQIAADGMITMSISPSLTERLSRAESRSGAAAPVNVREADTVVRVRENDTIVVAGLMDARARPAERKVPLLGDLPGIGAMFREPTTSRRRTDLVILLTPTIMTPARVAQSAESALKRLER